MKQRHLLIYAIVWIAFILNPVFGQNRYSLKWYTDTEGLPQNSVKSIFKDKYGFIWLSTDDGLARYDGSNFKIFNSENVANTNASRMCSFYGDVAKDSVYTTSENGELILIHQRTVKKIPDSLATFSSFRAAVAPCLLPRYKINYGLNPFLQNTIFNANNTYFVNRHKWFFINHDSLYEINRSSRDLNWVYSYKNSKAGQYFYKDHAFFHLTPEGRLYRFKDGVKTKLSVNTDALKNIKVFVNKAADQIFFYNDETIWLVEQIDENNLIKKKLATNLNLYPAEISSFFFDKNTGTIYVGSLNKGLGIIRNLPFNTIINPLEGTKNIIFGMSKLNDSTLITGTGLVIQNNQIIQRNNFKKVSDKFFLVYLHNFLWTFKSNRLYQLKNTGDYRFSPIDSYKTKPGSEYSLLLPKGSDSLWLATTDFSHKEGALYAKSINPPDTGFHKITKTDFRITSLHEINKDSLYLGSEDGGLYLLKNYRHNPEVETINPDLKVRGFHKDGSNFWVTSYNRGFAYIKGKKLIYLPLDKNHYLNNVHCIIDDDQGHFWLTTNRGLFKVSKSNLHAYVRYQTNYVYYNYYNKSYGFLTNEFNGGCYSCGLKMKNSRIYFPSLDGVVGFSPTDLKENPKEGDVYIEGIKTDDKAYTVKDSLTLKKDFNRLTVSVAYPYYNPLNNVKVEAQLQGDHQTQVWTPIGANREISYTNLEPGAYTIKVRKRSNFAQHFQTDQVHIYIPPAFWQTLWFKLVVVFLNLVVVMGTITIWIKSLKRKKHLLEEKIDQRTRFLRKTIQQLRATENDLTKELSFQKSIMGSISHDLITPTKYLTIFSKKIYNDPKNYERYNNGEMALIHQTSRQINNFIENLLIYTKANINELDKTKETILLRDFATDCKRFLKIPLKQRNITFENRIDPQITLHTNVDILRIIVQNILDNAIKNNKDGRITMSCFKEESILSIIVEDDGIGMEEERLILYREFFNRDDLRKEDLDTVGLGFKIIKQLLPYIKGSIDIDSIERTGTTFKITCDSYTENTAI